MQTQTTPNPKIQFLFPTFLSVENIGVDSDVVAIKEQIFEKAAYEPSHARSNYKGWHSDINFFNWSRGTEQLRSKLEIHIRAVIKNFVGCDTNAPIILVGWANILYTGNFNLPHIHMGAALSGCYYLDVGESSAENGGQIAFLDPRGAAEASAVAGTFLSEGGTHSHTPQNGELVIFPPWLKHFVVPYKGKSSRLSIAFNVLPAF